MKTHITLKQSYQFANELMKKKAVNFYHAFKNLDESRFSAVLGVYAFCRFVDDLVDEEQNLSPKEIREQLTNLKNDISRFYSDKDNYSILDSPFKNEQWFNAFIDSITRYPIQQSALKSQIRGQLSDLEFEEFHSLEDLIDYSKNVAGSVGIILMPMIIRPEENLQDPDLVNICLDLGIAMQITNILRDIGEDITERNRIYLPKTVLTEHQLDAEIIASLVNEKQRLIPQNFKDMWETLATEAERRYNRFNSAIMRFDTNCRLSLLVASFNYRAILDSVRKEDYNCLTQRCYTSKATRIKILNAAKKALKE